MYLDKMTLMQRGKHFLKVLLWSTICMYFDTCIFSVHISYTEKTRLQKTGE